MWLRGGCATPGVYIPFDYCLVGTTTYKCVAGLHHCINRKSMTFQRSFALPRFHIPDFYQTISAATEELILNLKKVKNGACVSFKRVFAVESLAVPYFDGVVGTARNYFVPNYQETIHIVVLFVFTSITIYFFRHRIEDSIERLFCKVPRMIRLKCFILACSPDLFLLACSCSCSFQTFLWHTVTIMYLSKLGQLNVKQYPSYTARLKCLLIRKETISPTSAT